MYICTNIRNLHDYSKKEHELIKLFVVTKCFSLGKRKNLIRLGVEQGQTFAWSRSRMGGWATSQSPILRTTITLDRLKQRGYESMSDIYERISPQLNEPLYTACPEIFGKIRTYSGVRSSPPS